jgi:hypothetical protein
VAVASKATENRHVVERELLAQKALEELGCSSTQSVIAKEVISEVVEYFRDRAREAAARFLSMARPSPGASKETKNLYKEAEDSAPRYMRMAGDYADKLINYQAPKLSHTTLVRPDPFESMTDDELHSEMMRRAKDLGLVPADAVPKIRGPKTN